MDAGHQRGHRLARRRSCSRGRGSAWAPATGSLARFLSSASWSRAPGPCVAPLPVTILTLPCQEGFCSRAGPLSARSIDGTARLCVSLTATAGAGRWGGGRRRSGGPGLGRRRGQARRQPWPGPGRARGSARAWPGRRATRRDRQRATGSGASGTARRGSIVLVEDFRGRRGRGRAADRDGLSGRPRTGAGAAAAGRGGLRRPDDRDGLGCFRDRSGGLALGRPRRARPLRLAEADSVASPAGARLGCLDGRGGFGRGSWPGRVRARRAGSAAAMAGAG